MRLDREMPHRAEAGESKNRMANRVARESAMSPPSNQARTWLGTIPEETHANALDSPCHGRQCRKSSVKGVASKRKDMRTGKAMISAKAVMCVAVKPERSKMR